jgi:hypothetical protein
MNTPKITVGNVRNGLLPNHDIHLYCGRGNAPAGMVNARLGNPHHMNGESQRHIVCELYEADLVDDAHPHWKLITRIGERLAEGKSIALYCFCAPKRCHCDTIKKKAQIQCALMRDPMNPFIPAR